VGISGVHREDRFWKWGHVRRKKRQGIDSRNLSLFDV
jgi:hypothetical protein